jgi:hypothetical protein
MLISELVMRFFSLAAIAIVITLASDVLATRCCETDDSGKCTIRVCNTCACP